MLPTHGKARANGRDALLALAALVDEKAAEVTSAAERLGTRDCARVALEVFGAEDAAMLERSEHEYSFANFVRSVLSPVRNLPATRLRSPLREKSRT